MSGSLKLSQFRNTTTLNNDLVIGNPRVTLSTDHDTRYLVFQISDLIGPANNPFISCAHSGVNDWTIAIGDASGIYNFAFVDKANIFTENNTFSAGKTVTFNGPIVSNNPITANSNVTLGDTNADTLTVNAVSHFFDNLTVDGNFTSNGTTTFLNTTNTNIKDSLITLNKGGVAASGGGAGIEVEENASITAYMKIAPIARDTWDMKVPVNAGIVSFQPQATVLLTCPSTSGTLALLTDVSAILTGFTASRAIISDGTGLISVSATTSTEIGYLSGVTSSIQTQLNNTVDLSSIQTITGAKTLHNTLALNTQIGNIGGIGDYTSNLVIGRGDVGVPFGNGTLTLSVDSSGYFISSLVTTGATSSAASLFLGVGHTASTTNGYTLTRNETTNIVSLELLSDMGSGSSIILKDRTNGTRYEVYMSGGVLTVGLA